MGHRRKLRAPVSVHADKTWLWLDSIGSFGSFPPYAKIKALQDPTVEGIYFNPEDPLVNAARFAECHEKGLLAGMISVPRVSDPVAYVTTVDAQIKKLGNTTVDAVMLDIEFHDADWIRKAITGYRRLRPGKATDFTNEPFQDGAWGAATSIYPELVAQRMDIYPQCYLGDMTNVDPVRCAKTVADGGAPIDRVHGCYDGANYPAGIIDGLIFTAERMRALR